MRAIVRGGGVLLAACAALLVFAGGCGGEGTDLGSIVKEAKAKSERFEKEIMDMTMAAQLAQETPQGAMSLDMKILTKGRRVRTEMVMPQTPGMPEGMAGAQMITIYDGTDTWMIHPAMGKMKTPGSQSPNPLMQERDWWKSVSDKTVLSGKESVGGRDCHVIDFSADESTQIKKLWLDSEDLMMVQVELPIPTGQSVRVLLSDFRPLQGEWKVPYKTEVFQNENIAATMTITSVEVNTGLSDDLFDASRCHRGGEEGPDTLRRKEKEHAHEADCPGMRGHGTAAGKGCPGRR